jgi:hypothetical protein
VEWTAGINVDASTDGYLEKTGQGYAGAISKQEITSPSAVPQGVSFTPPTEGDQFVIGLSNTNTGTGRSDIDFAVNLENLAVNSYSCKIYEFGAQIYGGTTLAHMAAGTGANADTDVFKVQVIGIERPTIQYLKNDQVFYTSLQTPYLQNFPLHIDTAFIYSACCAEITDVSIYSASTGLICSYGGAMIALFSVCGMYPTIALLCMFYRRNSRDPSLQQLGQISSGHRHGSCGGVNVTVNSMTGLSLSVHADEHVTVLALKKYVAHQESGEHSHTLLFLVLANTPTTLLC